MNYSLMYWCYIYLHVHLFPAMKIQQTQTFVLLFFGGEVTVVPLARLIRFFPLLFHIWKHCITAETPDRRSGQHSCRSQNCAYSKFSQKKRSSEMRNMPGSAKDSYMGPFLRCCIVVDTITANRHIK